jgi:flagellar basal-body rod protein FlgC
MHVYQTWLDAIADNVANASTVRPTDEAAYQARFVIASSVETDGRPGGAQVAATAFGDPLGRVAHQPDHPLADEDGQIRIPDMELSDQMTHLLIAQRAYQANVSTFRAARDAYQRALEIGR